MSHLIASPVASAADLRELELDQLATALSSHPVIRIVPPITRRTVSAVVRVNPHGSWLRCMDRFLAHLRPTSPNYQRLYQRLESVYDAVMRRRAVS